VTGADGQLPAPATVIFWNSALDGDLHWR
jgi:hypothetical protein